MNSPDWTTLETNAFEQFDHTLMSSPLSPRAVNDADNHELVRRLHPVHQDVPANHQLPCAAYPPRPTQAGMELQTSSGRHQLVHHTDGRLLVVTSDIRKDTSDVAQRRLRPADVHRFRPRLGAVFRRSTYFRASA